MTIQITQLDNGVRVVTDTMSEAESVVLGAWIGTGARHEPWNANGVAHLVEHMMFKGTETRSAYALSSAIENKGGEFNAHTSREATVYYAHVLPEEVETAVDIISDMLTHSVFSSKELDREKQVIIQEIGRYLDSPEDHVFDLMNQTALPHQKIGRPVLGTAPIIQKMSRSTVAGFVARNYVGANTVLVAAGNIAHDDFVELAKHGFGFIPRGKKPDQDRARVSSGSTVSIKDIEQAHIILGFAGPGYRTRKAHYSTQILSLILGGSSSSRLFQKVREKRGLVYSIHSAHAAYQDAGVFQIYAGTDPSRLHELMPVVCNELTAVKQTITRGELNRAKAQLRASLLMSRESVMTRAEIAGSQMLAFGKPVAMDTILKQLAAITADDVKATAARLFTPKMILAALGPVENLEDFKTVSDRFA